MTSKNTHSRSNESNLPEDIKASEADMAKLFAELPLPPTSELDDSLLRQASSAQAQSSSENMSPASSSCLLYTSPSPRDATLSRMPSSA